MAPWSIDLCQATTFVYLDDIVTTTFGDLSTVHVTTIHNYSSSCTHTYINNLNEHVHSFDDDSDADDDSDDDDVPDLMDSNDSVADDDMPDLGFVVAQAG